MTLCAMGESFRKVCEFPAYGHGDNNDTVSLIRGKTFGVSVWKEGCLRSTTSPEDHSHTFNSSFLPCSP